MQWRNTADRYGLVAQTLPLAMKSYQAQLARVVHIAFHVLLFAVPLTGWALATADG